MEEYIRLIVLEHLGDELHVHVLNVDFLTPDINDCAIGQTDPGYLT